MTGKKKPNKYSHVFRDRLSIPSHVQGKVMLPCVFHGDSNPSLSVDLDKGVFYCFGGCVEPKGGGPIVFLQKWAEVIDKSPILAWEARMIARGRGLPGKLPSAQEHMKQWRQEEGDKALRAASRPIIATYPYQDERGELLFEVVRQEGKNFMQRRPGPMGSWAWNLNGVRRVIYRLPDLQKKPVVIVVEGEKDADRLWAEGVPATTSPGGAGKWKPDYAEMLKDAEVELVVVLPDNDDIGRDHAAQVARTCRSAGVPVVVVELPNLPEKGDVSDWLDAGNEVVKIPLLYNPKKERDESCQPRKNSNKSTKPSEPLLIREPVPREPVLTRTPVR